MTSQDNNNSVIINPVAFFIDFMFFSIKPNAMNHYYYDRLLLKDLQDDDDFFLFFAVSFSRYDP